MDKKIAVILKCKLDASSYYRLYQYFEQIKKEGTTAILYEQIPEKVYLWYYNSKHWSELLAKAIFWSVGAVRTFFWVEWDRFFFHSDILVLNRKFYARKMPLLLRTRLKRYLEARKLIWDFDDNIMDDREISKLELELISDYSNRIVVTNEYLKEKLTIRDRKKTILMPTTDLDLYSFDYRKSIEERLESYQTSINIVWIGSRNNVKYLKLCISELDRIAVRTDKKVSLYVICNKEFNWTTQKILIQNIRWNRMTAIEIMKQCHLGIMPLQEDAYTLGKAGFKIVQYFGAAIPALASAVGYNNSIIEEGKNGFLIHGNQEWHKMEGLIQHAAQWKSFARNARFTYEEKFNPLVILEQWKTILNDLERIE